MVIHPGSTCIGNPCVICGCKNRHPIQPSEIVAAEQAVIAEADQLRADLAAARAELAAANGSLDALRNAINDYDGAERGREIKLPVRRVIGIVADLRSDLANKRAEAAAEKQRAATVATQRDELLRAELLSLGRFCIEQKPNMMAIKARIERQIGRLAAVERAQAEQPTNAPWGIDGQRDPDFPCDMFRNGKPSESNTCEGDGHALCKECGHYRCDPPEVEQPAGGAS